MDAKLPRTMPELRRDAREDALRFIGQQIDRVQVDDYYAEVPMALKVQNGLVTLVRATGDEFTHVVGSST